MAPFLSILNKSRSSKEKFILQKQTFTWMALLRNKTVALGSREPKWISSKTIYSDKVTVSCWVSKVTVVGRNWLGNSELRTFHCTMQVFRPQLEDQNVRHIIYGAIVNISKAVVSTTHDFTFWRSLRPARLPDLSVQVPVEENLDFENISITKILYIGSFIFEIDRLCNYSSCKFMHYFCSTLYVITVFMFTST